MTRSAPVLLLLLALPLTACAQPASEALPTPEALEEAALDGDLERVQALLQDGADPDGTGNGEPLARAVLFGYADVVQALLDAGADPSPDEAPSLNTFSALYWAEANGDPLTTQALVDAGHPRPEAPDGTDEEDIIDLIVPLDEGEVEEPPPPVEEPAPRTWREVGYLTLPTLIRGGLGADHQRLRNLQGLADLWDAAADEACRASGAEARVQVDLAVNTDGTVTDAQIRRSLNPACDAAALATARRLYFVPYEREGRVWRLETTLPFWFGGE